jgi:hypothetical protein
MEPLNVMINVLDSSYTDYRRITEGVIQGDSDIESVQHCLI